MATRSSTSRSASPTASHIRLPGRSQQFDVFDAATNALLDTRTLSNYTDGTYIKWTVTGSVRVRVTRLGAKNAVISGVFIGAGAAPANQPPVVSPSTIALRADFIGTLGAGGNAGGGTARSLNRS